MLLKLCFDATQNVSLGYLFNVLQNQRFCWYLPRSTFWEESWIEMYAVKSTQDGDMRTD